MFVGHYSAALAVKAVKPEIPLWHLFIAVQFVDYLWAIFLLMGIEHVQISDGFMAASNLDLYHMPYTHSLLATVFWGILAFLAYGVVAHGSRAAAVFIAVAVMSHWLLDLLVHTQDLELYPGGDKYGFGLWNSFVGSQVLELGLLFAGTVAYAVRTRSHTRMSRFGPWLLFVVLVLVQVVNLLPQEKMPTFQELSINALVVFSVLALFAWWIERLPSTKMA
ncbi:MAG: hypothetical protein AB8B81_01400 [Halioglobus sp.]